jgi:YD repeat-containing protein
MRRADGYCRLDAADEQGGALRIFGLVIVGGMLVWATSGLAATERFDYDALGRLIRHVDSSGTITEYAYDAVGNILEVRRSNNAGPPRLASVAPTSVRRGQTVRVAIAGSQLAGARVSTSDPELDISGLTSAATAVAFTLGVSPAATLGARVFTVSTATGDAILSLLVNPQLPEVGFAPPQVALTSGQSQQVTLRLSNSDHVTHTVSLAIPDAAVASVSPASVTFQPGVTQATITVSAVARGLTVLTAGSQTLTPAAAGVTVSAPFVGQVAGYSALVGVYRHPVTSPATMPGTLAAPSVGVLRVDATGTAGGQVGTFLAPSVGVKRE